ncbi:TrkA family potassium uptake protein [Aerococcaceae bacterium DSM 111020]|nr:TrkA family potassium uptake protein [Aerococcaceae bacterium DSM 111020]
MKSTNRIGVLGLGIFGTALARSLTDNGVQVIGIDEDMDHVREVMDDIDYAVQADFTQIDQLQEAGIDQCQTVVIASSLHLEDVILAIMNLEQLGVSEIIVKSKNESHKEVLKRVGAHKVILPERDMGVQIGQLLSQSPTQSLLAIDEQHEVIEFKVKPEWIGKTISELDLRSRYHVNIIAIGSVDTKRLDVTITPDQVVQADNYFVGITEDLSAMDHLRKYKNSRVRL